MQVTEEQLAALFNRCGQVKFLIPTKGLQFASPFSVALIHVTNISSLVSLRLLTAACVVIQTLVSVLLSSSLLTKVAL